jgi:electron transport complex protein RnfG
MTPPHTHAAPPPAVPEVAPWRLFATLGVAGAAAGLLIVVVWSLTQPTIQRNKAERLRLAVTEVLRAPARFDTLYVVDGVLRAAGPAGAGAGAGRGTPEQVYVGYAADGRRTGFAIDAAEPGFADVVRLIFGYDPSERRVLGLKVLENKETPGLGDKIERDTAFVSQFAGAATPLRGVKPDRATGDPAEIDMITGATISSRAVVRIVNHAIDRLDPMIQAYLAGARR